MATYKINTSGKDETMELMTEEKLARRNKKTQDVSVKLSKNVLAKMKRIAMVQNPASDNAVLYAYITTTLNDYNA